MDICKQLEEILNKQEEISKDRLDFGFDSIYFRYAMIRKELAYYKAIFDKNNGRIDALERQMKCANTDNMHFYNTLEQLIHAHLKEDIASKSAEEDAFRHVKLKPATSNSNAFDF